MENIYQRNLDVLIEIDSPLIKPLQELEGNIRYRLDETNDGTYRIFDTKLETFLYHKDEQQEIEENFKYYREYVFLYLFGIGDGSLVHKLLGNLKHDQIFVVEPEIELIYIALHLNDFSKVMKNKRLIILRKEDMTFVRAMEIIYNENARFYAKVFHLHTAAKYYSEHFFESYRDVLGIYIKAFEHIIKSFGNNIQDALLGLRHHIQNLRRMIEHPKYVDFVKHKNSDLAVVVSTGPSLHKQLPLLKEAAPYITIISVDASYPILVQYGIKPDIVVSLERDEPTAKFFDRMRREEQDGIIFVCVSLQHQAVFDAIQGGTTVISMRPHGMSLYFELDDYGYVGGGMSAANMAHEMAYQMGYKKCVLIGQDLAYGKDGTSHSKGHVYGADQIKDGIDTADNNVHYETELIPAYGGEGMVESMMFWKIFLQFFEQAIEQTSDVMETINATEGGARIHGATEIPFSEALKKYASNTPKQPIEIESGSKEEQEGLIEKTKNKLTAIITEGTELKKRIDDSFIRIADQCKVLENKTIDEAIKAMDINQTIRMLDEITTVRNTINNSAIYIQFFSSLAQSMYYQQEIDLATIKVMYVDNPRDNQIKAIQWILGHRYWLFSLSGVIHNAIEIIETEMTGKGRIFD